MFVRIVSRVYEIANNVVQSVIKFRSDQHPTESYLEKLQSYRLYDFVRLYTHFKKWNFSILDYNTNNDLSVSTVSISSSHSF